jgi:hypothetical protein
MSKYSSSSIVRSKEKGLHLYVSKCLWWWWGAEIVRNCAQQDIVRQGLPTGNSSTTGNGATLFLLTGNGSTLFSANGNGSTLFSDPSELSETNFSITKIQVFFFVPLHAPWQHWQHTRPKVGFSEQHTCNTHAMYLCHGLS